jgi:hypothetical protein
MPLHHFLAQGAPGAGQPQGTSGAQGQGDAAAAAAAAAAQMATLTVAMGHSLENAGAGTRPGTGFDQVSI